jgi:hypothetical protein
MNQALYAHMNNKRKKKEMMLADSKGINFISLEEVYFVPVFFFFLQYWSLNSGPTA